MGFDKETVRERATGQWPAIASQAFGIPDDFLTTKHGSCPKCGGGPSANRWRVFDDFPKTGGAICNQCGKQIGDGFALGQWFLGISFDESITKVAEFLKLEEPKKKPATKKTKSASKQSKTEKDFGLELIPWRDRLFDVWASTKAPITAEAVKAAGGRFCKFQGLTVIAIPFTGMDGSINGFALYNATGGTIPYRPEENAPLQQLKVRNVGCKQESGWAGRFHPGEETIKAEGVTDMLAILSCNPNASVICNPFGAGENPRGKYNSWMLDPLRGQTVYVVHDCDKPGQEGATFTDSERPRPGWAPCIAAVAKECRNVVLPYEVTENHGKDVRDFLNDQIATGKSAMEACQELMLLARSSPAVEGKEEANDDFEREEKYHVDDPNRLALVNLKRYQDEYGRSLKYWNQTWYKWKEGQYIEVSTDYLTAKIRNSVQDEFERVREEELEDYRAWRKSPDFDPEKDKGVPKVRKAKGQLVNDVYLATRGMCSLSSSQKMHDWIRESESHEGVFVSVKNGILNVSKLISEENLTMDQVLIPHTPNWFSTARLNFSFDPNAGCANWLNFLDDVFNGDEQTIDALQKWFGYLLTPDNSLQKILFVIGRMRSGKGTIIHVMRELFGTSNVCTPKLGSLSSQFALQSLANKTVAIIADARLSRHADDSLITETLLSISGGDPQDIDRKFKDTLSGYEMRCRFSIFSNLIPNLKDLSSAIVSRCIFLHMPNSYLGREDIGLLDRLKSEMSGILNWAIAGRHRLNKERRIHQPEKGKKLIKELEEMTSPIVLFMEEQCEFGNTEDHYIETTQIFAEWESWCKENDIEFPGSAQSFCRKMKAIRPEIETIQFKSKVGAATIRGRKMKGVKLKPIDF